MLKQHDKETSPEQLNEHVQQCRARVLVGDTGNENDLYQRLQPGYIDGTNKKSNSLTFDGAHNPPADVSQQGHEQQTEEDLNPHRDGPPLAAVQRQMQMEVWDYQRLK